MKVNTLRRRSHLPWISVLIVASVIALELVSGSSPSNAFTKSVLDETFDDASFDVTGVAEAGWTDIVGGSLMTHPTWSPSDNVLAFTAAGARYAISAPLDASVVDTVSFELHISAIWPTNNITDVFTDIYGALGPLLLSFTGSPGTAGLTGTRNSAIDENAFGSCTSTLEYEETENVFWDGISGTQFEASAGLNQTKPRAPVYVDVCDHHTVDPVAENVTLSWSDDLLVWHDLVTYDAGLHRNPKRHVETLPAAARDAGTIYLRWNQAFHDTADSAAWFLDSVLVSTELRPLPSRTASTSFLYVDEQCDSVVTVDDDSWRNRRLITNYTGTPWEDADGWSHIPAQGAFEGKAGLCWDIDNWNGIGSKTGRTSWSGDGGGWCCVGSLFNGWVGCPSASFVDPAVGTPLDCDPEGKMYYGVQTRMATTASMDWSSGVPRLSFRLLNHGGDEDEDFGIWASVEGGPWELVHQVYSQSSGRLNVTGDLDDSAGVPPCKTQACPADPGAVPSYQCPETIPSPSNPYCQLNDVGWHVGKHTTFSLPDKLASSDVKLRFGVRTGGDEVLSDLAQFFDNMIIDDIQLWSYPYDTSNAGLAWTASSEPVGLVLDVATDLPSANVIGSSDPWSVSAWVYRVAVASSWDHIVGQTDGTTSTTWALRFGSGTDETTEGEQLQLVLNTTSGVWVIASDDNIPLNTWTHVGASVDPTTGTASLFVDGALLNLTSSTTPTFTGPVSGDVVPVTITSRDGVESWSGDLDEVVIWRAGLSEDDMTAAMTRRAIRDDVDDVAAVGMYLGWDGFMRWDGGSPSVEVRSSESRDGSVGARVLTSGLTGGLEQAGVLYNLEDSSTTSRRNAMSVGGVWNGEAHHRVSGISAMVDVAPVAAELGSNLLIKLNCSNGEGAEGAGIEVVLPPTKGTLRGWDLDAGEPLNTLDGIGDTSTSMWVSYVSASDVISEAVDDVFQWRCLNPQGGFVAATVTSTARVTPVETEDPPPNILEENFVAVIIGVGVSVMIVGLGLGFLLFRGNGDDYGDFDPDLPIPEFNLEAAYGPTAAVTGPERKAAKRAKALEPLLWEHDMAIPFALLKKVPITEADDLTKTLVFLAESRGKSVEMIRQAITNEVGRAESAQTLFRSNSSASKMLKAYSKLAGLRYMFTTLYPTMKVLTSAETDLEVDPMKMKSSDDENVNKWSLLATTQRVLVSILRSVDACPVQFRVLCNHMYDSVEQRWPGTSAKYSAVGGFIFLRFFCPAITAPESFGLAAEVPTNEARRLLVLVAKTLQNLSNGVEFGVKELYMAKMNEFIHTNVSKIRDFFNEVSKIPANAPDRPTPQNIPNDVTELALVKLHKHMAKHESILYEALDSDGKVALQKAMAAAGTPMEGLAARKPPNSPTMGRNSKGRRPSQSRRGSHGRPRGNSQGRGRSNSTGRVRGAGSPTSLTNMVHPPSPL